MSEKFNILQRFGRGIRDVGSAAYGLADKATFGALPMGPIQQEHKIPLKAYIEKRRIKGEVLDSLRGDVEYYIRNGMHPELAVKTVLQNKRIDFEKTLDPNSEQARAIAEGDTKSPLGKNAHRSANIFKYFENASPKEYANMFKPYDITDGDMVKGYFTLPDTGYSEEIDPNYDYTAQTGESDMIRMPSLKHLPSPEFNKLGLIQNEAGEWVPGRNQPVGGYGAENSMINRANPHAGPEVGYPVSLGQGTPTTVVDKTKTQKHKPII